MSGLKRLRITAKAMPESMSAYAAEPFMPTMPKLEPGRGRRPGLKPKPRPQHLHDLVHALVVQCRQLGSAAGREQVDPVDVAQ